MRVTVVLITLNHTANDLVLVRPNRGSSRREGVRRARRGHDAVSKLVKYHRVSVSVGSAPNGLGRRIQKCLTGGCPNGDWRAWHWTL